MLLLLNKHGNLVFILKFKFKINNQQVVYNMDNGNDIYTDNDDGYIYVEQTIKKYSE